MCINLIRVKQDIVMIQSGWRPAVEEGDAPLWQRLADMLAADIARGALEVGAKLPPHRDLAYHLGAAVGTVGRAYAEAGRRGLVESHIGRGTFVAARRPSRLAHRARSGRINLAMNVPPVGPALEAAGETLERL